MTQQITRAPAAAGTPPAWALEHLERGRTELALLRERDAEDERARQEREALAARQRWQVLLEAARDDLGEELYHLAAWEMPEEWRGHSWSHDAILQVPGVGAIGVRYRADGDFGRARMWVREEFPGRAGQPSCRLWAAVTFETWKHECGPWDVRPEAPDRWLYAESLALALALAEEQTRRANALARDCAQKNEGLVTRAWEVE
jgi:hypothetical protein